VIIASFSALGILLVFVLPGYWTRILVSRKLALPQTDSLHLLLQCVLISFVLDVVVLVAWLVLIWCIPSPVSVIHFVLTAHTLHTSADLVVLMVAVLLSFAMGTFIAVTPWPIVENLLKYIITFGGTVRTSPLAYYLFTEFPKVLTAQDTAPSTSAEDDVPAQYLPWVDITCVDGNHVIGTIFQYGLDGPDQHDLILAQAKITQPHGDDLPAVGFVYVPSKTIVRMVIAYSDKPDGTPRIPWENS
jgi:hypothetical protein